MVYWWSAKSPPMYLLSVPHPWLPTPYVQVLACHERNAVNTVQGIGTAGGSTVCLFARVCSMRRDGHRARRDVTRSSQVGCGFIMTPGGLLVVVEYACVCRTCTVYYIEHLHGGLQLTFACVETVIRMFVQCLVWHVIKFKGCCRLQPTPPLLSRHF